MIYEEAGDLIERMGWQKNVRGNTRMLPWALSNPEREPVVEPYRPDPLSTEHRWRVVLCSRRMMEICHKRGMAYAPVAWLVFDTEEEARACATTIKLTRSACP